jgi:hypothetical protein
MKLRTAIPVAALALVAALTSGCKQDKGVNAESPPAPADPGYTAPGPSTAPSSPSSPSTSAPAQSLAALKVKNALMTSSQSTGSKNIDVDYEGGAVHLRGTVSTSAQKAAAEKAAKQAAGDTPVKSHLTVGK